MIFHLGFFRTLSLEAYCLKLVNLNLLRLIYFLNPTEYDAVPNENAVILGTSQNPLLIFGALASPKPN